MKRPPEQSLPVHLQSTLAAVREGRDTSDAIYRRDPDRLKITRQAINKRLEQLRSFGFLTRVRLGKFITYSEVKVVIGLALILSGCTERIMPKVGEKLPSFFKNLPAEENSDFDKFLVHENQDTYFYTCSKDGTILSVWIKSNNPSK